MLYILKDKKPVEEPDAVKWGMWMGDAKNSRVLNKTIFKSAEVSTVFLGVAHG